MPIDVSTFLSNLAETRRAAQIAARSRFTPSSDIVLPDSLEAALRHRFFLTPASAQSDVATNSADIYVPSCEREQVEYWYSQYGADARWAVHPGLSNLVILEIDLAVARHSLAALSEDDESWQRTLKFCARGHWYFLYESVPRLPRLHGYLGLKIHASNSAIVVPPSIIRGSELAYEDARATLLSFPWKYDPIMPR